MWNPRVPIPGKGHPYPRPSNNLTKGMEIGSCIPYFLNSKSHSPRHQHVQELKLQTKYPKGSKNHFKTFLVYERCCWDHFFYHSLHWLTCPSSVIWNPGVPIQDHILYLQATLEFPCPFTHNCKSIHKMQMQYSDSYSSSDTNTKKCTLQCIEIVCRFQAIKIAASKAFLIRVRF